MATPAVKERPAPPKPGASKSTSLKATIMDQSGAGKKRIGELLSKEGHITANQLVLGIFPDEKIALTFQTKTPGTRVKLRSVTMDFNYYQDQSGPFLDAYEKVLQDCMLGDQLLFWRQDGVEACWSFLTPILEGCEICNNRAEMLHTYEAGTWGPPSAILGQKILPP